MTDAITSDLTTARKTTRTVAAVLLAAGAWQVYRARPTMAAVLLTAGGALAIIAIAIPPLALAFHRAWMGFAAVLGAINTRILLTLVFFGLFTPFGAWRRMTGKDPLERRIKPRASYWTRRTATRQTHEGFERAF